MASDKDKLEYVKSRGVKNLATPILEKYLYQLGGCTDHIVDEIIQELQERDGGEQKENGFSPVYFPDLPDEVEDYDWIWENFFAKEHLFLFSSLPKAGKTTFISSFLKSMIEERKFLGRKTKKTNTLIVSEEATRTWIHRKKMMGSLPIYVMPREFSKGFTLDEWIKLIDEIYIFCIEKNIELIFFDVIDKFWGVQNENDAADVKNNIPPLFKLTKAGFCVVLVQHMRKSRGMSGTATRGSNALTGSVDGIIEFDRYKDNNDLDKRRTINVMSRLNFEPIEVLGEYDPVSFNYEYLGAKNIYKLNKKTEYLLEILPKEGNEGMSENKIKEITGKNPSTIKKDLKFLIGIEKVKKTSIYVNGRKHNGYVLTGFKKVGGDF